jgi:hypothetical protein
MDERELSLVVVGLAFPNEDKAKSNRRFEAALCEPGELVELRRAPKNKHDAKAVAVFRARGTQLGYLSAERAPWIGGKILLGEEIAAVFQQVDITTAVVRVKFGGGIPSLPPPRVRQSARSFDDFERHCQTNVAEAPAR